MNRPPSQLAFCLNKRNGIPIYIQLEEQLRLQIHQGQLKAKDALPSIQQLSFDLEINKNTVARAYRDLRREGLLELKRGTGSFVAENATITMPRQQQDRLVQQVDLLVRTARRIGIQPVELLQLIETRWDSKYPSVPKSRPDCE